jgi:hypothetical protein
LSLVKTIRLDITAVLIDLARENAQKAEIGGVSHIRTREERQTTLSTDQFVGQIGQLAGSLWHCGSPDPYIEAREKANLNPTEGDGGHDILGLNLDFKGSLMRRSRDPLDYRLIVRPRERHPGWIYVPVFIDRLPGKGDPATVYLTGWATDEQLPPADKEGLFVGAHCIPIRELTPLPPFRWSNP